MNFRKIMNCSKIPLIPQTYIIQKMCYKIQAHFHMLIYIVIQIIN